ncbi:MAG: VWA domain-containing protein [Candidatus Hodarchaeales archaeon]|jgi:uncharacterized protein with von Willebrand factor type A (vWA) domain
MSVILNFVESLRFFGLPISPSETITAQQVYEFLGAENKQTLNFGLKAAILKRHEDFQIFETCFDQYFSETEQPRKEKQKESSPESESLLRSVSRSTNRNDINIAELLVNNRIDEAVQTAMMITPTGGSTSGGISADQETNELQQRLIRALYRAFNLEVPIRGLTPVQRMELNSEIIRIGYNFQQFLTRINAKRDVEDHNINKERTQDIERPEDLYVLNQFLTQDLATVSATMANIKEHLLEIGKKLASRERRRRRQAKHGKLDFRRTIRKNLKNNGIMLELVQKHKRIEDPEIIILNDVSGSTRWIADWFFVICYTAQQVYKKIRVFEFDNTMVEVSSALDRKTIDRAMTERIKCWERPLRTRRIHSDYQDSLADFFTLIKHRPLTKRTTILILGDCRDFEGMWRHDHPISSESIQKMTNNSKGVIILNPESKNLWDAGDSVVKYYQQAGAQVYHVATLQDLLNFVFQLKIPN